MKTMRQTYIYRNIKNNRLYKLFKVSPPMYTGSWLVSEDLITKEERKLNQSSWREKDFIKVYET